MKLSIIIPVYNTEKYLERCLNSVVKQKFKEFEVLVILDGSPDNSIEICNKYKKMDKRIKVYVKDNEGLGLTRNYGIERAKGEYIAFLDSDDFVDENFYGNMIEKAKEKEYDIIFSEYRRYIEKDDKIQNNFGALPNEIDKLSPKDILKKMLRQEMGMSVWRSIYRLKIIKDNNIRFLSEREYISEDICFNFQFLNFCKNVSSCNGQYYYYCQNGASLSKSYRSDRYDKTKKLIEKLLEYREKYSLDDEIEKSIKYLFFGYVKGICNSEVKNNKKNAYKNINNILNDNIFIDTLKEINNMPKDKKSLFIYILMKLRFTLGLVIVYRVR